MIDYIWLVPALPLAGFVINGLLGRRLNERQVGMLGSAVVGLAFVVSAAIFFDVIRLPAEERVFSKTIYTWIATGDLTVDISFLVDPLSLVMILVVTGVGFLIHVYSIGYMHGDRGFARYFAFLNLFTFSMLLLVLADNFLLMFVGWEGVGLCSYLLIGFWYQDDYNAYAGRKAFVVNRVGDFGFLLGIFLIFLHFGSLKFESVFAGAAGGLNVAVATAITLLLFVGATGKSAQIPLHVWLPDAMAGPTPVSALIHAATMVTAGVYMVARCHVLYLSSPTAMSVVAVIGLATAFLAATVALVNNDIKRVLAYSTISQLGYMFLACGVGAFWAGIFHLSTHAYFKALLFLSAGSVMHALQNETDMTKMGALRDKLPVTYKVFVVGALALAGVPIFAGFFSKDEILWKTVSSASGGFGYWLIGALVAGLTAFYIFRLIYLTFFGESRVAPEVAKHIHESPRVMTVPLVILAVLSVIGGFVYVPHVLPAFERFLEPVFTRFVPPHESAAHGALDLELGFMGVSVLIAVLGIGVAYWFYVKKPELPKALAARAHAAYAFLYNKWYVDELYESLIVRPTRVLSEVVLWRWFDVKIIDGLVNGVAQVMQRWGQALRRVETGVVQNYALSIAVGIVILMGYFLLK